MTAEQSARTGRRDAEQRLERARAAPRQPAHQAATAAARLAAVDEQLARISSRSAMRPTPPWRTSGMRRPPCPTSPPCARPSIRPAPRFPPLRSRETAARGERDTLAREHAARTNRRRVITAERADWTERASDAADRVTDLAARQTEAEARPEHPGSPPGRDRRPAGRRAGRADRRRSRASPRGRGAVRAPRPRPPRPTAAARAAEAALAAAREDAVRAEGGLQQADHAWGTVAERILERLGANPALPDPPADLSPDSEDKARRRLERLLKEREEMGPVNLRAEQEAEEVEKQIATIETEREELTTAIAKLRGSIGHLNREGRERLTEVFQEVDQNFQQLFTRMFGGGRAHLALVGSDDPLRGRAGNLRPAARQETGDPVAAVRRRAGADRAVADLRGVPLQSRAGLRAGRGGRPARRRECGTVLHAAGGHGARDRHALPGGDPPPADHGANGPAVRRDHAGTRRLAAAVGRSGRATDLIDPPRMAAE